MARIAVIGGGASGLIAAYFASEKNNNVILFEKQKKLGSKILITGNGRCNISNMNIHVDKYHGRDPHFALHVFNKFGLDDTINFFKSIGIPTVEEKKGKLFPQSLQALSVVRLLEHELQKKGVEIKLHRRIDKICTHKNQFKLTTAGNEQFIFDSVILSTGSCAYSQVGSSKIGYKLARSLNHTVYEPFPALLPINIPLKKIHRLQGVKWNCFIKASYNNTVLASSKGELLFTRYGISGPVALDISRVVNEMVIQNKYPEIVIDFYPEYSEENLMQLLNKLWHDDNKSVSLSLIGIMKHIMPDVLLEIAGINPESKVRDLSNKYKMLIVKTLKELTLMPGNPGKFNDAVIAAGGIDVNEVNPKTMESKIIKNFFITGEVLDVDGDSGGYNLQFAWSTGAIAGMSQ